MISVFLGSSTIFICVLFTLVVQKISNFAKNPLWLDKLFAVFMKYSSWILSAFSIVLYLLMKKDVITASILLIPYVFLMTITFFAKSFENNDETNEILIGIIGIFIPLILLIFPHFWAKFIILIVFLTITGKKIYTDMHEYTESNKLRNLLNTVLYSFPILIFFIVILIV